MTPEALRIAVAEALGWTKLEHQSIPTPGTFRSTHLRMVGINPRGVRDDLPNYPTSLDACLPVIERLKAEGWHITMEFVHDCAISLWNNTRNIEVRDESPATALCLAALKALSKSSAMAEEGR